MGKLHQLLLVLCFSFVVSYTNAQQKYALLVGINQYYVKPGVPYPSALQGCVNDALAMKAMLIQRFGFTEPGITTLLDEQASISKVMAALTDILNKSKTGDAVVFYFSGHGVWMNNIDQAPLDKAVKEGMNQAMVMSDLYAANLGCLFTDATVKKMFNKFVDKKVILTAIFDCCFSAKLSMLESGSGHNPYKYLSAGAGEKSIRFSDVFGYYSDYCFEKKDSCNMDGLNDTLQHELFEPDSTRSFNLKDNLTISNRQLITRPAERPNSMFLSLAGTDDREKGLDIMDETGIHHGAYTKALLQAIKESPSTIPVNELTKKVTALMKKQLYIQNPINYQDPGRLNKNLVGIAPENFSNTVVATCIAKSNKQVILNAGLLGGLTKGNILSANKVLIKVTSISKDSAWATIKQGGDIASVKIGDKFNLTDGYTISAPIIKVFIPRSEMSPEAFDNLIAQKIIPLSKLDNYWDYKNWYRDTMSHNIYLNDPAFKQDKTIQALLNHQLNDNFLVFLPIPAYISNPLKNILQKNQNIKLVQSPADADFVLYLNYIKTQKGSKPSFIFTWYNFRGNEINDYSFQFNIRNVEVANLHLQGNELKKLSANILNMTVLVARGKSSQWMNTYPAR